MNSLKILVRRNPQISRCPECNGIGTLNRSRAKNTKEQIIKKVTLFRYYRCKECGWRGMKSSIVFAPNSGKVLLFYLLIIIVTAYVVEYLIKRFFLG